MKTFADLGLAKAGIKLIGPGDITTDEELPNMGDVALGVPPCTTTRRRPTRPANKALRRGVEEGVRRERDAELRRGGGVGRHGRSSSTRSRQQNGKIDPDKTMELLKAPQ